MNPKEQRIEETLESLNGIKRAEANSLLKEQILNRLQQAKTISIQSKMVWRAAACIAFLITVNLYSMAHFKNNNTTVAATNTHTFAAEYFFYINNN